jgi:glycosyltransferase involved in cell wall biosynthesis
MRILYLGDHLGNGGWHGGATYICSVLPRLKQAGAEVFACFLRERHPAVEALDAAGVQTCFLGMPPRHLGTIARLRQHLRTVRPDVVHVAQMESTFLIRLLSIGRRDFALVVHVHDFNRVPAPLAWMSRLLPRPEVLLCVSQPALHTAQQEYGIPSELGKVLHNGLDIEHILGAVKGTDRNRLRSDLNIEADAALVGTVGRFYPEKGIDNVVRAMPEVLRVLPATRFVFAGDGPQRAVCEDLADRLNVSGAAIFLGQRDDIPSLISACDVVAIGSAAEPFGLAAVEAMCLRSRWSVSPAAACRRLFAMGETVCLPWPEM